MDDPKVGAPDWKRHLIWHNIIVDRDSVTSPAAIYRDTRFCLAGELRIQTTADHYGIYEWSEDKAPSASATWDPSFTDTANAFDHDDGSCASASVTLDPGEELTIVTLDFGEVKQRFIRFKAWAEYTPPFYFKLYVSDDGSTWTVIYDGNPSSPKVRFDSFRYLKLTVYNSGTDTKTYDTYVCTIEAYDAKNNDTFLILEPAVKDLIVFVTAGHYIFYELIYEY